MRALTPSFVFFVALLVTLELLVRFVFVTTMEGRFDYGYHPTAGFHEEAGQVNLKRAGGRRATGTRRPAVGKRQILHRLTR